MSAEKTIVSTMTVKEHKKRLNILAKQSLASEKAQRKAEEKSRLNALHQKKLEEDKSKLELEKHKAEEVKKKRELIDGLLKKKMEFTVLDDAQWVQVTMPNSKEISIDSSSSIFDNRQDDNTNKTSNTLLLDWNRIQSAVNAASATASTLASSVATTAGAVISKGVSLTGSLMNPMS